MSSSSGSKTSSSWLNDVFLGSLTTGVNLSTLVLLNVVIGLAFLSILLLMLISAMANPALMPHVVVLLILSLGLWISINWFVCNIGLVDPKQQEKEMFGSSEKQHSE